MKSTIFIPKKCKVGFNPRTDTYTGMLGYVIYNDGKKWRKEDSWNSWIYSYMSPEDYEKQKSIQYENVIHKILNATPDRNGNYRTFTGAPEYWLNHEKITTREEAENLISYSKFEPSLRKYSNDIKIKPMEFDNVPMEGFVLNKKAGGYSSGWNARQTYCRVYDPRGFEFEITIPNLLYILENTNSIKGKGLEGKFVYGWDGKDLVLAPEESPEYKSMVEYTALQDSKVFKRDMVPGQIFIDSRGNRLTYLGDAYLMTHEKVKVTSKKRMWFYEHREDSRSGITHMSDVKSIKKYTGEVDENFANWLDVLEKTSCYYKGAPEYENLEIDELFLHKYFQRKHVFYCILNSSITNNKMVPVAVTDSTYSSWNKNIIVNSLVTDERLITYNSIDQFYNNQKNNLWQLKTTK